MEKLFSLFRAPYLRGYVPTGRFEKYITTNCVVLVQVIWCCYDRENGRVTLSGVGSRVDQRNNVCAHKRLVMKIDISKKEIEMGG
jgi:hypothetical protein